MKTNRWVHLDRVLAFYKTHRRPIFAYTVDLRPTDAWWIVTYEISLATDELNKRLVFVQDSALLISQQEGHIQILLGTFTELFNIQVMDEEDSEENDVVRVGSYRTVFETLIEHVEDQGTFLNTISVAFEHGRQDS